MAGNSFTILGSGSGLPQPDRACSGYLLKTGESLSLFDCGSGVLSSFLRCAFDPKKLDRVFISHAHSDHVSDLSMLIQMLHGLSVERRLDVFLPGEFVEPFEAYLNSVYLIRDRLRLDLVMREYTEGLVRDDDFMLTAIANSHIATPKFAAPIERNNLPNKMQSYSFKIEMGEKSVLYSADIGSFDDIVGHLSGVDIAVVEAAHIDMQHLFAYARESDVGQYVLTHLGNGEILAQLQRQVADSGLENVVFAEDGMRLEL